MNKLLSIFFLPFLVLASVQFDGVVNDEEWEGAQIYDLPFEIDPSYNAEAEHKTDVYIKHDDNYLYVAFKAYGNRDYIRANIRSRENVY